MARARFSHIVIASLSFLCILWSILIILLYSDSLLNPGGDCFVESPVAGLLYGVILFVLSVVAMVGAIREKRVLLGGYIVALWVWILLLIGSAAVLYVVANTSSTKATANHKEYRLEEYPDWIMKYTVRGWRWDGIKECMVREQVCKKMLSDKEDISRIYRSSILYGCCEPPLHCGFDMNHNGTGWEVPPTGLASQDPDCIAWKNNQVCYDCDSCKAGYLRTREGYWQLEANTDVLCAIVLAILSIIAFWGFKQIPKENNHPPPLPPPTNNKNLNV